MIGNSAIAEYQAARTVWNYVESVSEKEYSVLIRLNKSFAMDCPAISSRVSIDGKVMVGGLLVKANLPLKIRGNKVISAVEVDLDGTYVEAPGLPDQQLLKKFKFGRIETSKSLLQAFTQVTSH